MRVVELALRGESLVVVSFPLPSGGGLLLTAAEREIAELVVRGRSNKSIAAKRGTSERTVANQLASIYRKLGIHSRVELAVALTHHRSP